jgi:hypothetical protein
MELRSAMTMSIDPSQFQSTVDVYIQISFIKIYDIDTVNQRYQADAIIQSKWNDPSIKSVNDPIPTDKIWKPELYIENAINDVKEDIRYKVVKEEDSLMICEIRKVKCTLWERLELEDFPLDIQDLNLIVATRKSGKKINFILMQPEYKSLKISNTIDNSMWYLNDVVRTTKEQIHNEYCYGTREYPAVILSVKAFRSPGFFYWNAFLPILLITVASLGPFVIDYKMPQSRLPSTATMLLSSVSFRWVVGKMLPVVSYLTSLDKYALISMMIITIQLIYHAIIAELYQSLPQSVVYRLDILAFCFFILVIIVKQIWFLSWAYKLTKLRNSFLGINQMKSDSAKLESDKKKN